MNNQVNNRRRYTELALRKLAEAVHNHPGIFKAAVPGKMDMARALKGAWRKIHGSVRGASSLEHTRGLSNVTSSLGPERSMTVNRMVERAPYASDPVGVRDMLRGHNRVIADASTMTTLPQMGRRVDEGSQLARATGATSAAREKMRMLDRAIAERASPDLQTLDRVRADPSSVMDDTLVNRLMRGLGLPGPSGRMFASQVPEIAPGVEGQYRELQRLARKS